jgi:branched-chain amino acid transport system substrate-binding protein
MPLNLIEIDAGRKTLFGVAQFQDQVVYKRPLELRSEKINLEVVIANDRGSRSQAKEIAEYLTTTKVHGQPIAAVIGHYTSPITCDTLKIYSQAKMVLMSSTSTIVNLRNCGDSNSVFFRTISTTQTEAETLFKAFQQQVPNGKKIGIFYNAKEGFSQDLFNQFSAILKRENIEFVTQNLAESFDVEQKVTEMQDAAALAIFPDGQTNNADAFNRGVKVLEQNQAKKLVLAANTFYNNPMRERVKRLTENRSNPAPMIVSADWFYEQDRAENFRRDINEYWGGDLGDKIALAYEAAQALVTALKNSPRDLRQSLSQINLESDVRKGRMIRFDRSGDRQSPERVALKTSKTGFVLLNPQ